MASTIISQESQIAPIETHSKILSAAAETFAAKGFRASAIKDIAAAAKVNEVTVFRHFPKKQQLYWAAVDWKLRKSGLRDAFCDGLARRGEPSILLRELSARIFDLLQDDPALIRLLYFTVLELDEERKSLCDSHLNPLLALLATKIKVWVHEERIRDVDPEAAAVSFLGCILTCCQVHQFFGIGSSKLSISAITAECEDIWFSGIACELHK